jgi:hypothetical protein
MRVRFRLEDGHCYVVNDDGNGDADTSRKPAE